jgi:ATP-dependent Clp protease ATP-binding subunit ClpB
MPTIEIRRTIQILSRKTKSNPVLLGSPGVGKTAILEGLAQRIVNKEVPEVSFACARSFESQLTRVFFAQSLQNKRLLTIDLASLLAGSGIRGQFEERFKSLLADIQEAQQDAREEGSGGVICFIDELREFARFRRAAFPFAYSRTDSCIMSLDTLLNLGKAEGSMDAGNVCERDISKPMI